MAKKISELQHPEYIKNLSEWEKFRLTYAGGTAFVEQYMKQFTREEATDFTARKEISPCPAHAKAAINDIKNSIFQRMVDITREGGPKSYQEAVITDVDFAGNTMNGFIGRIILPELLSIGKVGVFVDKPPVSAGASKADAVGIRPYLYEYHAEDILSWTIDRNHQLTSLLLLDHVEETDEETGLAYDTDTEYRFLKLENGQITVRFFDSNGIEIPEKQATIALPEIPFVIFELSESLLKDVADYQIALLNANSSDLAFIMKANFPFYTEQYSQFHSNFDKPVAQGAGTATEAVSKPDEIKVGITQGRRYAKDVERPGFIHPSPEPLLASMDKQRELKSDIRQLVNLALANIAPKGASAESKKMDERSLESGLSHIGLELEYGERRIAYFWTLYEGGSDYPTIRYPEKYSLTSDADTMDKADKLIGTLSKIPSLTYQQVIAKLVSNLLVGSKIPNSELIKIHAEIDKAPIVVVDRESIKSDIELGLVSAEFASKALGYPAGEADKAQEERAARAASIVKAQSEAKPDNNGASDLQIGGESKTQKTLSQDHSVNIEPGKAVHK